MRIIRLGYKGVKRPGKIPPYVRSRSREPLTEFLANILDLADPVGYKTTRELRDYAQYVDNASLWVYDTEKRYEFTPPGTHSIVPERISSAIGEYSFPQPYVVELPNCMLVGPKPLAKSADGDFLLDSSVGKINMLSRGLVDSILTGTNPFKHSNSVRTIDSAVLLAGPLAEHYPHWFHDYLTRIEGVKHYTAQTERSPPLIIPSDPPEWMTESLLSFGFSRERFIEWDYDELQVNRLIMPSIRQNREVLSASDDRYICRTGYDYSDSIRRRAGCASNNDYSNKILINRKDAATRRMVNLKSVEQTLSEYGYESYTLSEMPWMEQVQLFAGADRIVGVHGAGLVNMIYSSGNTSVVELFGRHVTPGYYSLSNILDYEYYSLECSSAGQDVDVNLNNLKTILDNL